jgi:hypothetical protein
MIILNNDNTDDADRTIVNGDDDDGDMDIDCSF